MSKPVAVKLNKKCAPRIKKDKKKKNFTLVYNFPTMSSAGFLKTFFKRPNLKIIFKPMATSDKIAKGITIKTAEDFFALHHQLKHI